MKQLSAGTASALGVVEPMSATIFSVILFHEPLTVLSVCGIVLILSSILCIAKSEKKEE